MFSYGNEITWNDLYDNFFIKLNRMKKLYKKNDEEIYEGHSLTFSLLVFGMIVILFIVCMFSSPLSGAVVEILIAPVLFPLLYFIYNLESIPIKVFLILLEIPVLLFCFF